MKKRKAVKLKRLIVAVLIFVAVVFTIVNLTSLYSLPSPSQYMLLNPALGYFSSVTIATFYTSMARLSIVDTAARDMNNKTIIYRRLMNSDRPTITISEVALVQPKDLNAAMLDTTKLEVDLSKLGVPARPLIAPPFITGSLSMDRNAISDVLIIGLGGSQMNNFIHHFFPQADSFALSILSFKMMNITIIEIEHIMVDMARQYFGLSEDSHQHVVVMDALDYLEQAVREGRKFDAIYVDACPTAFPVTEEMLCPIYGFIDNRNIANLKESLKETGTLMLKMLLFSKDINAAADNIAQKYRAYFPICITAPMMSEYNRILVCSSSQVSKEQLIEANFNKKQNEFYEEFGLIMIEDVLLHLRSRPKTSKKAEVGTLLLLSLTTVTIACAFNFAGAYFWTSNFQHDMRYISAFHIFESTIVFVGALCLAFGIVVDSISLIAVFIATMIMIEDVLLHLRSRPKTSKKAEVGTLLLLSLTTVTIACAFNFAGAYFWTSNFQHDMRYISAFHIFESTIVFVGALCLAFGIVVDSISLIAVFIATMAVTLVSRTLCIVFSFGFLVFNEEQCTKTFYASIHRNLRRSTVYDDKILSELVCRREVCGPLFIINIVLLIFQIASIISSNRYIKILQYEKEAKLRQLIRQVSPPSPLFADDEEEEYRSEKTVDERLSSPKSVRSVRTPSMEDITSESVKSSSSTRYTKSSSSNSLRPSLITTLNSSGEYEPSDFVT
ncbi:Methyltransferase-like protein 13 [Toxocara canis]|uniref:Methyltransferase-like protein 13 n=1 Tax=Toxocara canis TaxID=6265 RepID=A0A0B2VB78_TOXCA|nr:Methyltransferase-like protein 13 [Toxocara canis]